MSVLGHTLYIYQFYNFIFINTFSIPISVENACLAEGKKCNFPFKYRGETYNKCTYDYSEGKPWCQTNDTKEDGTFEEGWGVCDEKCPHDRFSGKLKEISLKC